MSFYQPGLTPAARAPQGAEGKLRTAFRVDVLVAREVVAQTGDRARVEVYGDVDPEHGPDESFAKDFV